MPSGQSESEIAVLGEAVSLSDRSGLRLPGRSDLVEAAVSMIDLDSNVLLFGVEGSGRTAVLHEIADRLRVDRRRDVTIVDGSAIDDAVELLALTLQALGVRVATDMGVPQMLGGIGLPKAPLRVIAVDDVAVSAAQELFGRWHRHLWRLGARWVVVGSNEDPTLYLDAGADSWWEDGVLAVLPLQDRDAHCVVARYFERAGLSDDVPADLLRSARGLPRELVRQARACVLERMLEPQSATAPPSVSSSWRSTIGESPPYELTVQESRFVAMVRDRNFVSLADVSVMHDLGWSYAKAHGIANGLVQRGILRRSEAPSELGRPRVVFSASNPD